MRELTGSAKAFGAPSRVGPVSVTEALLKPLLAADAARPLITHYDDRGDTRIELSRATVANWAAKTANWLRDELDAEPGSLVAVTLPPHWQTVGVLLGAWWCGATVTGEVDGALVAFVPPAGATGEGADTVAAVALDPLGRGLADPPAGMLDYVSEARVHGDDFVPWEPVSGDTPALPGRSVQDLVQAARNRAAELGITDRDRVLSTVDFAPADALIDATNDALIDGLLAILAAGASLVLVTHPDPAAVTGRAATEQVTATLGVDVPGIRRLGADH